MKSSHSHCTKVQKALLRNKKFYCIEESFTAQQKVLLCNRRCYYTTKSFTTQQKSQSCGKNWRNVHSTVETEDQLTLQHLPLDLDLTFAHNLAAAKWYFDAKRQARLPS